VDPCLLFVMDLLPGVIIPSPPPQGAFYLYGRYMWPCVLVFSVAVTPHSFFFL